MKPQFEIISDGGDISKDQITEGIKNSTGKDNSIAVYNSEGLKLINSGKPITKKLDDGSFVVY